MANAGEASKFLGMRDYFTKRFMEITLLGFLGAPHAEQVLAVHFDELADLWPVASGTAAGIKLNFPTARNDQDYRECLRARQRGLGHGTRHVPLVRVSAFSCFWQGALKGSYLWPVLHPSSFAPAVPV